MELYINRYFKQISIKKEARGNNDDDLGEVQEIGQIYIVTQKKLPRQIWVKFGSNSINIM
ncbi:MAG: hypothetical protein DLM72_16975 [Candidatus Nitrosopolaris wilkensis]|nr:MAG: hypothetical protein DLM72_16975 [Candidatus Nitrosopolaris wilkensis]